MGELKDKERIRTAVRETYAKAAGAKTPGCGCTATGCCGAPNDFTAGDLSQAVGYSIQEINTVPEGANLGLGCGNPQAIAALKPGEIVLDLGSGGGFDAFLAARQIGDTGRVIGVDMTPEMISKSRINAEKGSYKNVEFRLGEIENLPVADETVDVIISNCVINLSTDKPRVFREAYRTLKKGGRLAVSDVVAFADIPEEYKQDLALYAGCIAGASSISEVEKMLLTAGFCKIRIIPKEESRTVIRSWAPGSKITDFVISASIEAIKPGGNPNVA